MQTDYNRLSSYRKRSELYLSDIAFLLDTSDISVLSRYERSRRAPSLPFLLLYHLLFDTPIEGFFSQQCETMRGLLLRRIPVLVDNLRSSPEDEHARQRISFLESVAERLSRASHEGA